MAEYDWLGRAGLGGDTDSDADNDTFDAAAAAAPAPAAITASASVLAALDSNAIATWLEGWGKRSDDTALAAKSHRFLRAQILALSKRITAHSELHRANQAARRHARDLERQRVGTEWMPQRNASPAQGPVPRAATTRMIMDSGSSQSHTQAMLAAPASASASSAASADASSNGAASSSSTDLLTDAESAALAAAPLEPIVSVSESSAPSGYILSAAALARRQRKESGQYQQQKEKQAQQRLAKQSGKPAMLTTGSTGAAAAAAPAVPNKTQTHSETRTVRQLKHLAAHRCYVCKLPLTGESAVDRHATFTNHCATCGEANNSKRDRLVDLKGKVAVLTGARIKIGYQIGLRLLRCGATLLATSRFPANALCRYQQEADYASWASNLHLLYADLCNPSEVTALAARIATLVPHVDIVINNAAQTVRRPLPYYANLNRIEAASQQRLLQIAEETHTTFRIEAHPDVGRHPATLVEGAAAAAPTSAAAEGPDAAAAAAVAPAAVIHAADLPAAPLASSAAPVSAEPIHAATATFSSASSSSSSALSASPPPASLPALNSLVVQGAGRIELPRNSHTPFSVIPSLDHYTTEDSARLFPPGKVDTTNDHEPLDLRASNSWSQKSEEVDPRELAEVLSTNAMAPFVLSNALKPLLLKSPHAHRFLILVSSMEGKLNRSKTDMHAHTNMAKAALNAFTRTVAAEWALERIYMNSVDTGWNSEERAVNDPRREANFETPLDCADGAARVLDPIFEAEEHNRIIFGQFLKDYTPTDW